MKRYHFVTRDLQRALGDGSLDLNAQVARLAVLYEDLRIEAYAVAEPTISVLDQTSDSYRKNYFLRRSIATLTEFAEAFRRLEETPDFQHLKSHLGEHEDSWRGCVRFFRTYEPLIAEIRNNMGGHFGEKAARFAISTIAEAGVGTIVYVREAGSHRTTVHLEFAEQIAARVAMKTRGFRSKQGFARHLVRIAMTGWAHAAKAVQVLTLSYIDGRFRK